MDQKDLLKVSERLYEYQMLYPDTTLSSVNLFDNNTISHKDGLELSKLICHMTHSGLLQFWIFGEKMYIFRSEQFLKVADGFKEGSQGEIPRPSNARRMPREHDACRRHALRRRHSLYLDRGQRCRLLHGVQHLRSILAPGGGRQESLFPFKEK